ncbi:MAG: tetratricopeptide (TPR) repeat protein, partial [Pirellulaceae bacterium]
MLVNQSRYEMAEDELRQGLAEYPNDAQSHAILALCLAERDAFDESTEEVQTAIGLDPEQPFAFYAYSIVLLKRNFFREATTAINEAIALDPLQPDYFAQLAQIHLELRDWKAALAAADQGLATDAEHVTCANIRAIATVRMGNQLAASESLASALVRAPEDSTTHANVGWTLINSGQHRQAMESFREALRLDPNNEWARLGIVEAMKARFFVYRIMLNWFLWMMRLSGKAQWQVTFGAYLGYMGLTYVANANPAIAPYLRPILYAYIAFVIMTWIASPMFNLVLRLNRFGRYALNAEEISTSNWVGLCVLGAVTGILVYCFTGTQVFLLCALAPALVIPPLAACYSCSEGWPRITIRLLSFGLGIFATALIILSMLGHFYLTGYRSLALQGIVDVIFTVFLVAAIGTQFATNYLVSVRPRRTKSSPLMLWLCGVACIGVLIVGIVGFNCTNGLLPIVIWGEELEPQIFAGDIRPKLIDVDKLDWIFLRHLEEQSFELQGVPNFKLLGDYQIENQPDIRIRLFTHPTGESYAAIVETEYAVSVEVSTAYTNGDVFTWYSGSANQLPGGPTLIAKQSTNQSASELAATNVAERPADDIRAVLPSELPTHLEELLANHVDFLLQRGGPTLDELRSLTPETLSSHRLARIQAMWRRQASVKYGNFILAQFFRDSANKLNLSASDAPKLFAVHDLMEGTIFGVEIYSRVG